MSNQQPDALNVKVRFLLTRRCSARCAYCHNEGQADADAGASLLPLHQVAAVLDTLIRQNCLPQEIVLSGGEPTLHKQVASIARLCKSTGAHISMASHGGHPYLLMPVLPWLDELKLHIDDVDPERQWQSMGIALDAVQQSIVRAQQFPHLHLMANHPLAQVQRTALFVAWAREQRVHVKIIHRLQSRLEPFMQWGNLGYTPLDAATWLHRNGWHRLFTKRCTARHNPEPTFFVDTQGIRTRLEGVSQPIMPGLDLRAMLAA
ncbi:MAG: radical SAM protein [Acidithiobacillus sp.]